MRIISKVLFIILFNAVLFAQNGKIEGTVTDAKTGDPLPGVNIILKGTYYGAASDFNGKYIISNISPGIYTVEVSFIGYKTMQYTGTEVFANRTIQLDMKLEESALTLDQDVIVVGDKPLVDVEETQSKKNYFKRRY